MEHNKTIQTRRKPWKDRQFIILNIMSVFTCLIYLCLIYLSLNDAGKADKVSGSNVKVYQLTAMPLVDGLQTIDDEPITSAVNVY